MHLKTQLAICEKRILIEALELNKYSRKDTADYLGTSRVTLYNKMVLHGVIVPRCEAITEPEIEQARVGFASALKGKA